MAFEQFLNDGGLKKKNEVLYFACKKSCFFLHPVAKLLLYQCYPD
jgi:hypothetical protein